MGVKWLLGLILVLISSSCAVIRYEPVYKLALLAPFEGRYREVGYNALYAARLALKDTGQITLLPVDDGGSAEHAQARAKALERDRSVIGVIIVSPNAIDENTLDQFTSLPAIVIGEWGAQPTPHVFIASNPLIPNMVTIPLKTELLDAANYSEPVTGGAVLALSQFPELSPNPTQVTVLSSSLLPDEAFRQRYISSDIFAPEPNLWATLTFDMSDFFKRAINKAPTREAVHTYLMQETYRGINGAIHFIDGYWQEAPIYHYGYNDEGELIPLNDFVEEW